MASLTRKKPKPSLKQLLAAVRELPPADQRRLRDELAKLAGVQLVRPASSAVAVRRGRRLAKTIRAELAKSITGSLDETMSQLRGRAWS